VGGVDTAIGQTSGAIYREFSREQPSVGPLREIYWNDNFIFARHAGKTNRNSFAGDTFQKPDESTNYFFVIRRHSDEIAGPFSSAQFSNHLFQIGQPWPVQWQSLREARKLSWRQNPFQEGIVAEVFKYAISLVPTALICFTSVYVVVSLPVVLACIMVRRVKHKAWDIGRNWRRGFIITVVTAIVLAMALAFAVAIMLAFRT
jgi:hypothetical protein